MLVFGRVGANRRRPSHVLSETYEADTVVAVSGEEPRDIHANQREAQTKPQRNDYPVKPRVLGTINGLNQESLSRKEAGRCPEEKEETPNPLEVEEQSRQYDCYGD